MVYRQSTNNSNYPPLSLSYQESDLVNGKSLASYIFVQARHRPTQSLETDTENWELLSLKPVFFLFAIHVSLLSTFH